MNVGSIGSSGSTYASLDTSIETSEFNSVSGQLAVLMLESQEQRKQLEQEQLASAREDFSQALAAEVTALQEQADAAFRGALVQGSLSIASAGFGLANVKANADFAKSCPELVPDKTTYVGVTSQGLDRLAQPLGAVAGSTYGAADAKSAQGLQQAAQWQLDDARDAVKDAEGLQDKALDWLSSMVDRDAATASAILANKV